VSETDNHEPPSGSRGNGNDGTQHRNQPIPKKHLANNPDPDLITFLEREAKPGEVKVWDPTGDGKPGKRRRPPGRSGRS
jgi:hypothetical protein